MLDTTSALYKYCINKLVNIILSFISAVISVCSPSCGQNSFCQEEAEAPSCICQVGYHGDGYNCTGTRITITEFTSNDCNDFKSTRTVEHISIDTKQIRTYGKRLLNAKHFSRC